MRKPSNHLLNIILPIVGLLCVATIAFCVVGIIQMVNPGDNSLSSQPTDATGKNPTDSSGNPTESTGPSIVIDQVELNQLIADAEFIAAGYDYEKAISMLQEYKHYADVPELAQLVASYQKLDSELVVYARPDTVTHVFFHSLIVDTDRAFDRDGDAAGYHSYMTTLSEFNAMMEEMYKRGYVLITPYDLAHEVTDENGNVSFAYGEIRLPKGKKPFIMSQDDLNYYSYMISSGNGKNEIPYWVDDTNDGFASKIVIGEDGYPTCEYVDAQGNVHYGDYDLVPALETFIQNHPDFSYRGARAVLGVTGYEGVFGYRTKPSYEAAMGSAAYAAEVQAAKDVAECLKAHGWIIASHSYGHPPYGNRTPAAVETDSNKWENTVQVVVGETDIILYPHGSDIAGAEKYTFDNAKFAALYEDGYRYFFNVDSAKYWNQLGPNYFRGGRRNLDGYRMYHNPDKLEDLFNVEDVWDPARPTSAPRL